MRLAAAIVAAGSKSVPPPWLDTEFVDPGVTSYTAKPNAKVLRISTVGPGGCGGASYDYYGNFQAGGPGGAGSFGGGVIACAPLEVFTVQVPVGMGKSGNPIGSEPRCSFRRGSSLPLVEGFSGRWGGHGAGAGYYSAGVISFPGGAGSGRGGGAGGESGPGYSGNAGPNGGDRGAGRSFIRTSDGQVRQNGSGGDGPSGLLPGLGGGGGYYGAGVNGGDALMVVEGLDPGNYDPIAAAAFYNMLVQPDAFNKGVVGALLLGLAADGILPKLDHLFVSALPSFSAGALNLLRPSQYSYTGGTFTPGRGFINTAILAPAYASPVFGATGSAASQNNASAGVYVNTIGTTGATAKSYFQDQNSSSYGLNSRLVRNTGGYMEWQIMAGESQQTSSAGAVGLWGINRSSATAIQLYKQGSLLAAATTTYSGRFNDYEQNKVPAFGGVSNYFGTHDDRIAAGFYGASLAAGEWATINSRIVTALTALGAQ